MAEHSSEAVAAYPFTGGTVPASVLAERTAFDRGMAERRVVEREALARLLDKRAGTGAFTEAGPGTPFKDDPGLQAEYEKNYAESIATRRQVHYDTADAILALPSTSLIGAREAVLNTILKGGLVLVDEDDPERARHEIDADAATAALFASGTITERREAEAGALEALVERYRAHRMNGTSAIEDAKNTAAQLRNGEADRG